MTHRKIGVGLYGSNGHQVGGLLADCPFGEVTACCLIDEAHIPSGAARYDSLEEMLRDPKVELVSLCSPRRVDQANDAITCLRAGRHVYAEKPAAFDDENLDAILAVARETGCEFHEMADTVIHQPFHALRQLVRGGVLGEVTQVWAQKAYKSSFHVRPQDEAVDGGLIRQCSIHAVRMVEHVTGLRVAEVQAVETKLGNPLPGELRTAASLLLTLENGAVGSIIASYWNPLGFGRHGNDQLRLYGTQGFAEITDDAQRTRLVVGEEDRGAFDSSAPTEPFLFSYCKELLGLGEMPFSLEEELHPLRVVNRAKLGARTVAAS